MEQYIKSVDPSENVDGMMEFRSFTGGFELLSIESSSEPLRIRFRAKERDTPIMVFGDLRVRDAQPPTVEKFRLGVLPPRGVAGRCEA